MDKDLALLHEKIDKLTAQMEEQRRRQLAFDELKDDMIPIANHLIKLTIDELAEIGTEFQLEDLMYLVKRLLRSTHMLNKAMDQLEGLMGLSDEVELLGQQVFRDVVHRLDEMEQKGYFTFANHGIEMVDRIVSEFEEEDVKALSDNIVTILKTFRNLTQPDIMSLANNAVSALRDAPDLEKAPSALKLVRELNDPQVRIGMARMFNLLKSLADSPEPAVQSSN